MISRKYVIQIEVDEQGYPRWLHDWPAEAALNRAQQETVKFLYDRYHSAQYCCETTQAIRKQFQAPLDAEAKRLHEQWERAAEQTDLMLREQETQRLGVAKMRPMTRKVG